MKEQNGNITDANKAMFLSLIGMFSMSALQELGKLQNPVTGKTEVRLDMAGHTIDLLDMLEAKTRGNRDAEEEKTLKDTLTMLKMNFVETKEQQAASAQKETPKNGGGQGEATGSASIGSEEGGKKEPKFRKSYS